MSVILKFGFIAMFIFMVSAPVIFAETETEGTNGTTINNPLSPPGGTGEINTIPDLVKIIITIVLVVGVPIVALAIIYTGFLFVAAQGNPTEIIKAKKALTYTLIGAALLLGSFVIAEAIGKTVDEIIKGA